MHDDAVRLLSYALTARDGVWWALLCQQAQKSAGRRSAEEGAVLQACAEWVLHPNRSTASAVQSLKSKVARGTSCEFTLRAVCVAQEADQCCPTASQAVSWAVLLAVDTANRKAHLNRSLSIGADVGQAQRHWEQSVQRFTAGAS